MPRTESMKCEKCQRFSVYAKYLKGDKAKPIRKTMRRLYIKFRGKWKTVGWICPRCGNVALDS